MTAYRNALPQLGGELFLTDGGLETTLIFHKCGGWLLRHRPSAYRADRRSVCPAVRGVIQQTPRIGV